MNKSIAIAYYRLYQTVFKLAMPILPWRKPQVIEGPDSILQVPNLLVSLKVKRVILITDQNLIKLQLLNPLIADLKEQGFFVSIYDKTVVNPTIDNIEEAFAQYQKDQCEAIIAFGGGSPMDCAKAVAARVARPKKSIAQMKGVLKVLFRTPTIIAIPTTAGTGSEVTLAAVVSNSVTHEKYAINDFALIPEYAILDPKLIVQLPAHITSTTGMDALTHAVEAFIGRSNTNETREAALKAIQLINGNLYETFQNPQNLLARANMQQAAYLAGVAFTRAYVGYVHAIAHTLGGFYQVPHGLANAVILPYVLEAYGEAAHSQLAILADHIQIAKPEDSPAVKAQKFINYIKELNEKMNIPKKIIGIQAKDLDQMIKRALAEANPLYPVPKIWFKEDIAKIYQLIAD